MKFPQNCKRRAFCAGVTAGLPLVFSSLFCSSSSGTGENAGTGEKATKEGYPAFKDARSKKVIFIAHCILNQNARIDHCAYTPSAIPGIAEALLERRIGIVQMPCPELIFLGLGRGAGPEIYDELSVPEVRKKLKELARDILYQIREYRRYGFKVLGVLGIDGSPSCGVDLTYYEGNRPGKGAFMEELTAVLEKEKPTIVVKGIKDGEPEKAVELIRELDS
ncbi:MAG: hypothetical protein U9N45_04755 [Gemmatimonadota bacterium]|nr:hypothetical protein [Gemmatimonadota bacterium]